MIQFNDKLEATDHDLRIEAEKWVLSSGYDNANATSFAAGFKVAIQCVKRFCLNGIPIERMLGIRRLKPTLSAAQIKCMEMIKLSGKLIYYPGGFWAPVGATMKPYSGTFGGADYSKEHPVDSIHTSTIEALVKYGSLKVMKTAVSKYGEYPTEVMINDNAFDQSLMPVGTPIGIFDVNGAEAKIGDRIKYATTEGRVVDEFSFNWDDKNLCITVGSMPYSQLMESGFIQSATPGKRHLDFELITPA